MSNQIGTALVNAFQSNIEVQFQQMESRLRNRVRVESTRAEFEFFDRVEKTAAVKLTTRHADTPLVNTPHSRRRVGMDDYVWADLIDEQDRVRMLADPQNAYVRNAAAAMNRQLDQIIIAAFDANAFSGKSGGTTVSLPAARVLQTTATDTANSGGPASNMTVAKLRRAKFLLDSEEAVEPGERRYVGLTASQEQSLLREIEVTSTDFNTQRALANGELNSFLGFEFIRTELFAKATNTRDCFAWATTGIVLATGLDLMVRVQERPDKNHSTQVFLRFTAGATRMWEEKIVKIQCDETV